MLAGAAALLNVQPSQAAFGDAANVFGKPTNTSGLIPYKGEGFSVELPSKWTPSREREVPNVVLRYPGLCMSEQGNMRCQFVLLAPA